MNLKQKTFEHREYTFEVEERSNFGDLCVRVTKNDHYIKHFLIPVLDGLNINNLDLENKFNSVINEIEGEEDKLKIALSKYKDSKKTIIGSGISMGTISKWMDLIEAMAEKLIELELGGNNE